MAKSFIFPEKNPKKMPEKQEKEYDLVAKIQKCTLETTGCKENWKTKAQLIQCQQLALVEHVLEVLSENPEMEVDEILNKCVRMKIPRS